MTPLSITLLSISMSTDAFAAALGRGAAQRPTVPQAMRAGLVFGVVEAITPIIGWALGLATASFVEAIDHWVAFTLLALVGGKMIYETTRAGSREEGAGAGNGMLALLATAIGTSIDAAAVGVSLALLDADILVIALCIGMTTFVFASIGLLIGRLVGMRLGQIVEFLGGVVLIGLGVKILAEHTGIF